MAEDTVTIDPVTIEDNADQRQVEFEGEASGTRYQFAVQYDVIEALSTVAPDTDAVALFRQHADTIASLGAVALARDPDQEIVVISENDLD
jgi:ethanolamine utilization protein EutP (predicted NTPase)